MGFDPSHEPMFAMMLDVDDLRDPAGWGVTVQRSIRTGGGRRSTELTRRARAAGGVSALRILRNKTERRSISLSVNSYASSDDAKMTMSAVLGSTIRKPLSRFTLLEARIVEGQEVPGLPETLAYEERSEGSKGLRGSRLVAGTIEHILLVVTCSALGEFWTWEEVISIATRQVEKIQSSLSVQPVADSDER
jgi:hypothetical protein